MECGRVMLTGPAREVLENPQMADLYFGGSVRTVRRNDTPTQDAVPTRP